MAEKNEQEWQGRLELDGFEAEEWPDLTVEAVDSRGEVLEDATVKEGRFSLSVDPGKVERVRIRGGEGAPLTYRRQDFERLLESGRLRIARPVWHRWWSVSRCVSGTVERCFPYPWVVDELIDWRDGVGALMPVTEVELGPSMPILPRLPVPCRPVCQGLVEVYHRRCCCHPVEIPDDVFEIPEDFPRGPIPDPIGPFPEPEPDPIPPPWPGPDPAPFEHRREVLTGGALDVRKLSRTRDARLLRQASGERRQSLLARRPYLWCSCGPPTRVGEGFLADDGSFSVCWDQPFALLQPSGCRSEVAYRVIQSIDGEAVTIYDGVAANQWFSPDEVAELTSYSVLARTCRGEPDLPEADEPIVLLHVIGDTESWHLDPPPQSSPDAVSGAGPRAGLLDPSATDGPWVNRPLGGKLRFRFFFSDGMQAIAESYRVEVAPADASGAPDGSFQTVPVPDWKTWHWDGDGWIRDRHSLGPDADGNYRIPYDDDDLLDPEEDWDPDQYHAVLDTSSMPHGRYLLRITVFDASGNRMKPNGAAGPGDEAGFIFGRWESQPGPAVPVPYSALTHLLWWDNRRAVADIEQLSVAGSASAATCQFHTGAATDPFEVHYTAYHPRPGTPFFLRSRSIRVHKGLGGSTTTLLPGTFGEVGEPPASAAVSPSAELQELLDGDTKCAFSVTLRAHVKTTDGSGPLRSLDRHVTAAFAAEITDTT